MTQATRPSRPTSPLRIALVAALLVLTACSGGSSTSSTGTTAGAELPPCPLDALDAATQPVDITVWHSMVAKQTETLQGLVDEYNQSQNKVRVHVENVAATDEELLRKFNQAVPSKDLPAIVVANDTATQTMADSGVILPAQSCVDASNYDLSPFLETARAYYTINGVLWAASSNPGSVLVYWNKDHFRRAGLDPDKAPATLAELRADAEAIKAAGVVDKPFVHELASYKTEFWLTGAHASIVNNDNGRAEPATEATMSDNKAALDLYTWFDQMNRDGLMTPVPVAEGQINQYLALATQQASIAVETSSSSTSIEAFMSGNLSAGEAGLDSSPNVSGLEIGAGPLPSIYEGDTGKTQMGGPAWYLTNTVSDAQQAAAWDFMTFMNGEEAQTKMLTGASFLPYRVSVADTPEAQAFFTSSLAGQWLAIANQQVRDIDPSFPGPLIGPYYETRNTIRDTLTSVLLDGVAPQDALDTAQQQITDALSSYAQGGF